MKINTLELQTERQWRSATGFDQERFCQLLSHFEHCYMETYGNTLNSRQVKSGLNYCIQNEEEFLLFTLHLNQQCPSHAERLKLFYSGKKIPYCQ
jgi:hypothetical protein